MEDNYASHRKWEGGMDFTLVIGDPDPDIIVVLSLAWVHLRRSSFVLQVNKAS
jgi:hypothetical protein